MAPEMQCAPQRQKATPRKPGAAEKPAWHAQILDNFQGRRTRQRCRLTQSHCRFIKVFCLFDTMQFA